MKRFYSCLLVAITVFFSAALFAAEIPEKVNAKSGVKLVEIATGLEVREYNTESENGFRTYQIFGKGECCGSSFYAVNIWTGNVWDNNCKIISNNALAKEQAKIKQHFKAGEIMQYQRLHNLRPVDFNLKPC